MKKIIAILLLVLYASVAFGQKANCSKCDGNSNAVSSSLHTGKSCERSSNHLDGNCCSGNAAICKKSENDKQVLIPVQPQASEVQIAFILAEFKINFFPTVLQQNLSHYTSYILFGSSAERLAFIHLLRI